MPRAKSVSDEDVLDLALEVILRRGPEAFTLAEVGSAANLSPATLLQRFGSKERLLDQALGRSTRLLESTLELPPAMDDPLGELVSWLTELARAFRTRQLVASNLLLLRRDLTDPRRGAQARRHGELLRRRIRESLQSACPRRRGSELDQLAAIVEAQWHGLVLQWALSGRGRLDTWLRKGVEQLLRAVL